MMDSVRVLIVEDDTTTATVAKIMCESLGCVARITQNGQEGVDLYTQYYYEGQPFDIVFMDLQLPVMGGFEATLEIRNFEDEQAAKPVPIIAVTGTLGSHSFSQLQQAGMNDCHHKPYTLSLVERLLCLNVVRFTNNITLSGKEIERKNLSSVP